MINGVSCLAQAANTLKLYERLSVIKKDKPNEENKKFIQRKLKVNQQSIPVNKASEVTFGHINVLRQSVSREKLLGKVIEARNI